MRVYALGLVIVSLAACSHRRARQPNAYGPAPGQYTPAPDGAPPPYAPAPQPGNGGSPQGGPVASSQPSRPRFATVALTGVTIGPGKADGTQWDGFGKVDPADISAIGAALVAPAAATAVAAAMARPTIAALQKPEVFGTAALVSVAGTGQTFQVRGARDSFNPQFGDGARWAHVPLDGSVRIRVSLTDEDLNFNDPIGTFEIGARDIEAAIAAGRIYQLRVAEQTNRQVLFAAIAVFAEP